MDVCVCVCVRMRVCELVHARVWVGVCECRRGVHACVREYVCVRVCVCETSPVRWSPSFLRESSEVL